MTVVPLILSIAAFLLLGLSSDGHHRRRFGAYPAVARLGMLRRVAWVALGAAFVAAIGAQGGVFGPILWVAAIMAGAAVAFLVLNLGPDTWKRG